MAIRDIWVLADDRAGNRSQCLGVAQALGLPYLTVNLAYTAAAALPNYLMGASFGGLTKDTRIALSPPWPDLIITAGRRTAPVARHIKALSDGHCFVVQVMHPGGAGIEELDLVCVPRHDQIPLAPNMMAITGAPHGLSPQVLQDAGALWQARFDPLPRPWIALIVGGGTKRKGFPEAMARDLGRRANQLAKQAGGSLLVTTSRRTGAAAQPLFAEITVPSFVFRWGDTGDNPYRGYLALADHLIVTGDSVSMCSEACAAHGTVHIFAPKGFAAHKHTVLHQQLYEAGYARPLDDTLTVLSHPPLNAAVEIAAEIRRRIGLSG
ncbi:MAG: mitochondrial fission ELM1 family protein [Magnetospiraceae bacterium]